MAENTLVLNQVIALLEQEGWAEAKTTVTVNTRLKEDLGLDSFDLVQLILALNHRFGLELGSHSLTQQQLNNIGSLVNLLVSQIKT
jgi:acyl carrier protein